MNNRNPSTTKSANKKKKGKQEKPSQTKGCDNTNNTKQTDHKNTQDSPAPNNVISEEKIENDKKCLSNVSQNTVNAATSKSVEQNLSSTVDSITQGNSDLYVKVVDHENSKSNLSDNCQQSSPDNKISKDEVDKAIQVKVENKEIVTNPCQDNLTHKNKSLTPKQHDSLQSYKIKQELLLAALEKPCVKKKDDCIELNNTVCSEPTGSNSKCPESKSNIEGATSENTAKTEKELRKLEWQKKLIEQNQKKEKEEGLSKAELKAKRREQQEAQRLAKLGNQGAQKSTKSTSEASVTKESSPITESQKTKPTDGKSVNSKPRSIGLENKDVKTSPKRPIKSVAKKFALQNITNHLFSPSTNTVSNDERIVNFNGVHPEFIRLGVKVSSKIVVGSNARCLALLSAVRCLVFDIQSPPKQDFCRYLESVLQKSVDHLNSCRPLSVCMKNALKYFKSEVTTLSLSTSEKEKKNYLIEVIDTYINDEIETAAEGIAMEASSKITNGDVVLTFGCSSLVQKVLLEAKKAHKEFEVIVVDSRMLEGREMFRRLVVAGVLCKYVQLHALSHIMKCASLVFLGAHALLSNGYIMSRIGTAKVAMAAKTFNKPVIVCSEAYKLSDLVQTDAFVHNELGDPNELINKNSPLASLKPNNKIFALNLLYDFTPPDFVRAVITELGSFHGKSVTSIRRKKPKTLL